MVEEAVMGWGGGGTEGEGGGQLGWGKEREPENERWKTHNRKIQNQLHFADAARDVVVAGVSLMPPSPPKSQHTQPDEFLYLVQTANTSYRKYLKCYTSICFLPCDMFIS